MENNQNLPFKVAMLLQQNAEQRKKQPGLGVNKELEDLVRELNKKQSEYCDECLQQAKKKQLLLSNLKTK
jgi:hypothetical protein